MHNFLCFTPGGRKRWDRKNKCIRYKKYVQFEVYISMKTFVTKYIYLYTLLILVIIKLFFRED